MITYKQDTITKPQIIFFATLIVGVLGGLLWIFNQTIQFRNAAYQSKPNILPMPTIKRDATTNWRTYTNTPLGFSFKYPEEVFTLTDQEQTQGTGNLIDKIELVSKVSTMQVVLLIWKAKATSLTKATIESWCRNTLRGEAAEQKVLCALLSPPAIVETTILGKTLYSTKYYSSFNDRTDFFIIPEKKYIFTIHVVTPNDAQDQTPLLLQILSTFKFKVI